MNDNSMNATAALDVYEIRLDGQLDDCWSEWFEGFTLTGAGDGTSTLTGRAVDQAALHGLLRRVGDLGVTLISVNATGAGGHVTP